MRIGSPEWYEAHPYAPTRAEAEEDAALARKYPTPVSPEMRAWIDEAYARAAHEARLDAEWEAQNHPF